MTHEIGRRSFIRYTGALGLLAFAPRGAVRTAMAAAPKPGEKGRFLTAHELDTLRAVCARFVPGPPEDPDPGALEAQVPEAIDMLLAAFEFDPPLIHTGGPFSNRDGARRDDMAHFVPLDRHAELGWRIRIEGTRGIREREFAGPVAGLQQIYRDGLKHLDDRAAPAQFVDLPGPAQDAILGDLHDGATQDFVGAAVVNTFEAMYGPPEYGGNRGLVGWRNTGWLGDRQPGGYTDKQVSESDPGEVAPPMTRAQLRALAKFVPGLAGRAAPHGKWWLARTPMFRG